ncbi:transposase [Trichonephila clavipes]|nr:transposase [Trichonephila clavipes]
MLMCKTVIHYRERKLLRGIDVPEKVLKKTNALDIHRLPAPLKTSTRFSAAVRIDQKLSELVKRSVVFHQDSARPHTSVVTRQKLWKLSWKVLMHPPHSPDFAPSDYYLFLALQNFLSDKKSGSREDCENRLLGFFANKDRDFYEL